MKLIELIIMQGLIIDTIMKNDLFVRHPDLTKFTTLPNHYALFV